MSDHAAQSDVQPVPEYVDQVVRKQRFLAEHPEVVITVDRKAPAYRWWRGSVPGHDDIVTSELGQLLDRLEKAVMDQAEDPLAGT